MSLNTQNYRDICKNNLKNVPKCVLYTKNAKIKITQTNCYLTKQI